MTNDAKTILNHMARELEDIGTDTIKIIYSHEVAENNLLFRTLTAILSKTFKTYVATQDLKGLAIEKPFGLNSYEKTQFKECRNEIDRLINLINSLDDFKELYKNPVNPDLYKTKQNLKKCANRLESKTEKLIGVVL